MMRRLISPETRFVADRRVLLHFKGVDQSLEGFIVKETWTHYWLQQGKVLETNNREFDLDGTLIVPKRDVFFCQVLATAAD